MKLKNYTVETLAGKDILIPEGQAVLDGNSIFTLNPTAKWYSEQLKEEKSFEELIVLAEKEFEAETPEEKKIIRKDLEAFLFRLRREGLIEE